MEILTEINWGIIGAGNVTEMKSGPAFGKVPHSRLVAIMRRDMAKAEDYARRHQVPRWYVDAEELIRDREVNAIYVATPPSSHASYAIRAMKAGKPAYVEKPMALNYRECLEMIRISKETGMPLFVAYYRRSLPAFLKVKDLVGEGAIGSVLTVNLKLYKQARERGVDPARMSWHVFPEISGAGYFYDLASHQFDYLDYLFGPVADVRGMAVNRAGLYTAEDTVTCSFRFQNGITGTGSWCFAVHKTAETDLIEIIGDEGIITFSCFQHGEVVLENREGIHKFRFQNPENIQLNLISQVVRELCGEGKCVSTGISAARTSRVLEEVVQEYYKNGK
ncbi:MAG TPA: Gfo/Idh/MocA family oxidoreductase [Prolixibacteraceae bacterium]|nr:Gfo/Idh/MocA family oxidoreductase [Prolixibacteraceae bacterium]HOS00094.1 Gfo/Idh/MocA family oxidoreductase [Prolixibacteraceae bacterium]HPL45434.1 Gfo/Idh/MocA family oxidoreductase [Prolixibacteraceae bacterium]